MRAVVTADYGSAPAVTEVETPHAGPGEVRVRIRSSSLNGFDTAMYLGYLKGMMEHRFPAVLGRDFAGTVDQVGEGVTAFASGDDVFGVVLTQPLNAGGFAEYLVVPEDHYIARIPAGLDHATAGVLGLAGAAATGVLEATAPREGEHVLVSGATGGVGAIALQMLAARGAVTIATAATDTEVAHVRQYGATHVVDHTGDLAAQVRAIAPGGVDVVLHLAGDPNALSDLLVPGGRLATLLGVVPERAAERGITVSSVIANPHGALLTELATAAAGGRLRVPVQRSYALEDVPSAFADFASGTIGKLAVRID